MVPVDQDKGYRPGVVKLVEEALPGWRVIVREERVVDTSLCSDIAPGHSLAELKAKYLDVPCSEEMSTETLTDPKGEPVSKVVITKNGQILGKQG